MVVAAAMGTYPIQRVETRPSDMAPGLGPLVTVDSRYLLTIEWYLSGKLVTLNKK